jgi:hypothetical protein
MMLTVKRGATVIARIEGHSAENGAIIPATAKITLVSKDPANGAPSTVATVGAIPAAGTQAVDVPLTIIGVGRALINLVLSTADSRTFNASATLEVTGTEDPTLVRVTLTLVEVK